MFSGRSAIGGGFTGELHPAVNLAVFLVLIQIVSASDSFFSLALTTGIIYLISLFADINSNDLLSKVKPFILLIFITFIFNAASIGEVTFALMLSFKFFLIILLSILLSLTTDRQKLLSLILLPFRNRAGKDLTTVCLVAIDFVPQFVEEAKEAGKNLKKNHGLKGIFKPEIYLPDILKRIQQESYKTADTIEEGGFSPVSIDSPSVYEIFFIISLILLTVIYAA